VWTGHQLADDGIRVEVRRVLVGEADDHRLAPLHRALGRFGATGDDVEQRRLARAVRSDDRQASTGFDQEIDVLEHGQLVGGAGVEALGDVLQLDDLVAEASGTGAELQLAAPDPGGRRTARDDLVRRSQPGLRLGRSGRRATTQPGQLLAGEDLAGRLLLRFAIDAVGTCVEVGGVGARSGGGLVDEAATPVEFDHLARADVGGQPIEGVAIVCDQHERRLHLHQARFEPLDRLEIEVVGRLVEHDHVVVAVFVVGEHPGERDTLGLAAGQFVGAPVEQRLHAELGGDGCDLPRVTEELAHRAGREHRILFERGDPNAPPETDVALVGLQGPGHDLQQRRLAGAVDTDHRHPVARRHGDGDVLEQHLVGLGHSDTGEVDTDHAPDATALHQGSDP
jgi:hypothetical protein